MAVAFPAVSDQSHFLEVNSLPIMRGITGRTGVRIIELVVIRLVVLDQIVALEMGRALETTSIGDLVMVEMGRMVCDLT